jgi:hypothetical protein
VPKLVPLDGNSTGTTSDTSTPTYMYGPDTNQGAPPPAVSPSTAIPAEPPSPVPLTYPTTPRTVSPTPVPAATPAPTQPPMPVPVVPAATAPVNIPPVAPAYTPRTSAPSSTIMMTVDEHPRRSSTDTTARYSSTTDPSLNPGLSKKRFSSGGSTGSTQPTQSSGSGF